MTKRRVVALTVAAGAASLLGLVLWGMGRKDVDLSGTVQWGFEESAFFPNGDCSKTPFWWSDGPREFEKQLDTRWKELGKPAALVVTVRADLSAVGMHGHLGKYRREIRPLKLITAAPSHRCDWWWGK